MIDNPKFQRFLIKDFEHWRVYLHPEQNYLGRVYLWAKRGNLEDLFSMTKDETREYFEVGKSVRNAILKAFYPDLFNYATLGNETKHLHTHIIPRYMGVRLFSGLTFEDKNLGKNYAPYEKREFGNRVLTNIKLEIKERLR